MTAIRDVIERWEKKRGEFARVPRSLVVGSMPRFTYGAHAGRACVVPRVVPNGTDPGAL
ncbi:MAG: hypothetical protein WEA80_13040 [Gemmatimonadaceae bacterium]